jgi:cytochrome b6-f complex iron-sulfur subunit
MNEKEDRSAGLTRREVLLAGWAATTAALVAQAGVALGSFLKPVIQPGGFGGDVNAGKPAEFKTGSIRAIRDGHFYISHLEDGGFLALSWRCTHLGCTIPWVKTEDQFHCPCHGSLFDKRGVVLGGPAPRPMDLFPIDLVDGSLVVNTGEPIKRAAFDPSQAFRA